MEGDIPSDGSPMKLETSKKRKRYGRMSEVRKKLNLSSHTMGEDCQCTLKCFEKVPEATRNSILKEFNLLNSVDMQNSYLCGLISEIVFEINLKKEVKFRTSFNGAFELASITTMDLPPHGKNEGEFNLPNFSYEGLLPIPLAKYQDLQALKKFCGPQAQEYYGSLPHE